MAFAQWSPRRVGLLWLAGLSAWGLLLLLGILRNRAEGRDIRRQLGVPETVEVAPANTLSTAGRDSLLGVALAILRLPDTARDSAIAKALAISRDPTLPFAQRRDSIAELLHAPAQVTPSQKDSLKDLAESLAATVLGSPLSALDSALAKAEPMIYLTMALYLAIPVVLIGLTLAWWALRRSSQRRPRQLLPNMRLKLSARGGRLKGKGSILSAAAAGRSLSAIR